MKKTILSALLSLLIISPFSKNHIPKWQLIENLEVKMPIFSKVKTPKDKKFSKMDLFKFKTIDASLINFNGRSITWAGQQKLIRQIEADTNGFVKIDSNTTNSFCLFSSYIDTKSWIKTKLKVKSSQSCEVYVDNKKVTSIYKDKIDSLANASKELKLLPGKHHIVIKAKNKKELKLCVALDTNFEMSTTAISRLTVKDLLNNKKIGSTRLSPTGRYLIMSESQRIGSTEKTSYYKYILDLKTNKTVFNLRKNSLSAMKWLPNSDKISYTVTEDNKKNIYVYDVETRQEEQIAFNLPKFDNFYWAPNEKFLVMNKSEDFSDKGWKMKKLEEIEDRLSYFRKRNYVYVYDIESKSYTKLTHGKLSTYVMSISPDSKKMLLSQSWHTYTEFPFSKQNIYELNLETMEYDTLFKERKFYLNADYSPDGKQLLISGGPSAFGKVGINNGGAKYPNNYDTQLYIYTLKNKKVEPITYNFDPSVQSSHWHSVDNKIYMTVQEKDLVNIYAYDVEDKDFEKLDTRSEYIKGYSLANKSLKAVYSGCTMNTPFKLYSIDLKKDKATIINTLETDQLKDVVLGNTSEWNFKNKTGKDIIGRVYYPPGFDENKKYPLIVYYYGGTSPVGRSFGGSYSYNLWAAHGFVVYVLQPTGATGFGQEFSSLHQNNWGVITADEIITGVKKFSEEHKFIDKDNMGCIGASYGGFTTMLLQTKTDIFKAAVSHAGISSITNYWGTGDWGYGYSTNASAHSYPWNNKALYVDWSPIYNADKVKNAILLFHGTIDNNVPPSESMKFYVALKLLGKDVEHVLIKDQQHWVLNLKQREQWMNSILAYFTKYLKDSPQWWNDIYPKKNL
jgi:dipeptidyl aminopeptidase/acylaminoacyl peptidase